MFFRVKPSGPRRYLQIVENTRDGARTVQRVVATLGRVENLQVDGGLDVLLRSGARLAETALLISSLQAGTLQTETAKRIGIPMIFGRLWEQTGCRKIIERLARGRGFGFSIERAVFVSVLHRLTVSGSDRACERWLDSYHIDGADALPLHQLYRAIGWLGEELADQTGATRAPRRNKDLVEEALFDSRRSLFNDLSMVLFDTTSLMFYGRGGETLGKNGRSKERRPDLHQVIVGVVIDSEGRPICSEIWPGNATDVKALLPVVRRLRERFGINRMCVCADRGMISAETIAELQAQGIEYILGARERSDPAIRDIVLVDDKPMVTMVIPRARDKETTLEVKEVTVGDWGPGSKPRRYIVCFNPEQAKRDAEVRAAILNNLCEALKQGDKQLVGNVGFRRFLATPSAGHFAIDPKRVADDARLDGLYVLRTNSKLNMLSVALAYRELWKVEAIFRSAKAILETRPVYHQKDATISGHLFCSFLALLLRKELDERLTAAGVKAEWADIVHDLERVEQIAVKQDGKHFVLRPQAPGCAGAVFQSVGVALPPMLRQLAPSPQLPPTRSVASKRRGRPRRGATSG